MQRANAGPHGAHVPSCEVGALSPRLLVCGLQGQTGSSGRRSAQGHGHAAVGGPSFREGWLLFCPLLSLSASSRGRSGVRDAARPRHGGQETEPTTSPKASGIWPCSAAGRKAAKTRHKKCSSTGDGNKPMEGHSLVRAKKRKMAEMLGTERRGEKNKIRTMQWIPDSS